jgi:hypothetical protein
MPYDSVFYGKIYARPILELRDTSDFLANYKVDNGKGIYNYSLKLPNSKVNRENIMGELQRSLDHAFGYKGIIERRSMPVWKLTARPGIAAKLRTHGGGQFISPGTTGAGFTVRNYDMSSFLVVASGGLPNTERLAFIDGTGIEGNIDITLDGDLLSLEGVRKALQKHGLDLMKDKKEMMVLVLKDPE